MDQDLNGMRKDMKMTDLRLQFGCKFHPYYLQSISMLSNNFFSFCLIFCLKGFSRAGFCVFTNLVRSKRVKERKETIIAVFQREMQIEAKGG